MYKLGVLEELNDFRMLTKMMIRYHRITDSVLYDNV